ncbi:2OG-Fe(II) oxygenase [Streptomyces sp. NPDC052396]|uniref:2OG-Fe(II) oxygenase n=1 Tax=Streptomyces sp. NPDC052396 TaxID=3365689 RepID=UPI0037D4B9C0
MTESVGVVETTPDGTPSSAGNTVSLATQFCRFDDVLGATVADRLLEEACLALMTEVREQGSGTEMLVPPSWRCAEQTARFPELAQALTRLAPMVMTMLGVSPLLGVAPGNVRVAFGFTMHNQLSRDPMRQQPPSRDAAGEGDDRKISFLYHLHRRPRGFLGGQTRIFDTTIRDGHPQVAESFRDVQPDHDSLVFFPSDAWYQVRPVTCPSAKLLDSRFAFHGWLAAS